MFNIFYLVDQGIGSSNLLLWTCSVGCLLPLRPKTWQVQKSSTEPYKESCLLSMPKKKKKGKEIQHNIQSMQTIKHIHIYIWTFNPNTQKSYKILERLSPKHAARGVAQSPYSIYSHGKVYSSKQFLWRAAGNPSLQCSTR